MSRTIIVSDLHIDTWTDRKIGKTGKSRKEHFFDLLDWCEQVKIRELVINGDLMDFPPYVGQFAFSGDRSIARDVIERLVKIALKTPVTYIYGNHDIGISGFRSMGTDSITPLRNINFCYPNYKIDDYPESTLLIEHGHFCDPCILLYLRDLNNRTYADSKFDSFNWVMQRRKPTDLGQQVEPGVLEPIHVDEGQNAYQTAKQSQQSISQLSLLSKIWRWLKTRGEAVSAEPTMEFWWGKAIEEINSYILKVTDEGESIKPTIYQIYGHTHRADPREAKLLANGISGIYINAGTWTEKVNQGWYLDVDETGKVWIQDWINETRGMKRL